MDPQGSVGAKVLFNLAYGLPTLAFLVFLTWRLKPALKRLVRSQSQIMRTYYSFLWVVCALNLFRCWFQIAESAQSAGGRNERLWNVMWLLTMTGMTVMEVSVVTFLSQGYVATGKEALVRTLAISGVFALIDAIVKMVLIFGTGTSLFIFHADSPTPLEVRANEDPSHTRKTNEMERNTRGFLWQRRGCHREGGKEFQI